jgi:hypothetical protein
MPKPIHLLLGLEVVEEDRAFLRLLTPIADNDARAVHNLASVTITIDLAFSVR